jgi:branched-chain amino acid transport system permease protein
MQALYSQLLIGLINGSFYALLSLGLSLIFGLLNIVNFAHGAFFMLGAFAAPLLLEHLGIGYWGSLLIVPPVLALGGMVLQRIVLRPLQELDHLYGLLATFGFALIVQGLMQIGFGSAGRTSSSSWMPSGSMKPTPRSSRPRSPFSAPRSTSDVG